MKVIQTTITPEQAGRLLMTNGNNRNISKATVKQYIEDMTNNKWVLNGDTIKVYNQTRNPRLPIEKHKLIDGQHRLSACKQSRVPLTTLVAIVDTEKVFETIDTGKRRSASDTLYIYGHKNCATLAASLALIKKIDLGGLTPVSPGGSSSSKIKNHELLELLEKYKSMPLSVQYASGNKARFPTRPAAMSVLHYKFCEIDQISGVDFLNQLHSGANLTETSPILHLRNAILTRRNSDIALSNFFIIKACYHAWNNWIKGHEVSRLYVTKGPLPRLKKP